VAAPPDALLLGTALGAARIAPVVWLVPAFGGARLPAPVRVGFALLLALLAAPVLVVGGSFGVAQLGGAPAIGLALALAREVVVGLCLGLVAASAFRAAEVAGRLADTLRGATLAEVLVPTSDERASPLAALYLLLATLVFLQLGGVQRLIEALAESYRVFPVAGGLGSAQVGRAAVVVTAASAKLIVAGVALAAPVIVALWLTDLALGLVARAAPQIPVYFVGLPLKGLLAVGVVLVGLAALQAALAGGLGGWLRLVAQTVAAFRG
jgi:type III secretion protein SpaR/YscT/HrcT